jgi:hypothetical protein
MDFAPYEIEAAKRLDGLFVGLCQPEEYEQLVERGVLIRTYEGAGGFMGLAKLRLSDAAKRTAL